MRTIKILLAILFSIAVASCGGGGGGGSTPTPTTTTTKSISGTVAGAANVTINLTGAASKTTTTDANGNYSFTGLASGSYTITPSLSGHVFTPTSTAVNVGGANVTGNNSTATTTLTPTYCLSGAVNGVVVQNVTITLNGANTGSTVTDASGNYSFCGLVSGNYTVTPSLAGYTLSPISSVVNISSANVTGNNLTTTTGTATAYKSGTSCPVDSNFQYSQWIANGSACSYQSATCYFNTPGVGSDDSGFWHTRDASGNITGVFDCKLNGGMSSYQISVGSCSLMYSAQVRAFIDGCNTATFALTTSVVGSGTVSASPLGPNYSSGTVVTLTATPNAGSTFSGWSGACAGTGSCVVTMDAVKAVTATFSSTQVFVGAFSGSGSFSRVFPGYTTCTWTDSFTGTITVTMTTQANGTTSSSAQVSGNFASIYTSGNTYNFTCYDSNINWNNTLQASGTLPSIAWTDTFVLPSGSNVTGNFAGTLSGNSITGTQVVTIDTSTGSASIPITLTKQ